MAYIHDGDGVAGLGQVGCGASCPCGSCQARRGGLGEHYYEGEGGDRPDYKGYGLGRYGELPGALTRDVRIVVKSYIAPIGSNIGSPYCAGLLSPTAIARLRALAAVTDAGFSEDPRTDAKDTHYRLYSARTFTVSCNGGNIVTVVPSPIDTDSGKECIPRTSACLQAPVLLVSGVTARLVSPTVFEFSWMAKGRPNLGAEPGMQMVCPRTSVYIWHQVSGRIECSGGEPKVAIRLTGSQFPSHRVFVNGVLRPPTIPQGPFSNLWVPSSMSDPMMVR
jgi:hypothetical protein